MRRSSRRAHRNTKEYILPMNSALGYAVTSKTERAEKVPNVTGRINVVYAFGAHPSNDCQAVKELLSEKEERRKVEASSRRKAGEQVRNSDGYCGSHQVRHCARQKGSAVRRGT